MKNCSFKIYNFCYLVLASYFSILSCTNTLSVNQNVSYSISPLITFKQIFSAVPYRIVHRTLTNDSLVNDSTDLPLLNDDTNYTFPNDFMFGCASAAYQYEGAWNANGKGESIWDHLTHTHPDLVTDHSNGDIACDSYYKFKEDIQLIKNVGFNFYRFSLSWPRILPNGEANNVNEAGVQYYNDLINELLANDIIPVVTIYHWDLPQQLSLIGGWSNPLIIDYFTEYCNVVFERFGDRVKYWITFNEPVMITFGYGGGLLAPGINFHGVGEYLAGHFILLSHAKVYHMYNRKFRVTQRGKLGITMHFLYGYPESQTLGDIEAAERMMQFFHGWFTHPIFSEVGGYPLVMRERIDTLSRLENRTHSRLPRFTEQQIIDIKGSCDFFGVNHYSSVLVSPGSGIGDNPSWLRDMGVNIGFDPSWPSTQSFWLKIVPEGFRATLNWIKREYNNPPVYVFENGVSDDGTLNDEIRVEYFTSYLKELLKAMYDDGCNVKCHTAWSLLDNFEWLSGYTQKFGLYHVDFNDDNRTRTEKGSVKFFQKLLETKEIPSDM